MGFTPNDALDLLSTSNAKTFELEEPPRARISVADALAESAMTMKRFYDAKHKKLDLTTEDKVYLRIHKGYKIPAASSKKLHEQYVGPFKITAKVGQNAYRLDIPTHWRIHPVFSIQQLEPAPRGSDPFNRPQAEHLDTVFVEGDDEFNKSYELERIVKKRTTPTGRVKYLIRWKGYGSEFDEWRSEKDLANAKDLIRDFEASEQKESACA
jgi:hypothetical protein